ncbi:DUF6867 family protein [Enterovirga sp.]|uniref:DUF6867 family protein n=1 Tax=Enterovirga sp. TaxID=2026350 RepID=UPI002CC4C66F|nr:hypothetical protein [Enterovirga sp.]HMO30837.1 hypothetical protein [Enterovirga sp.]
MQGILYEESSAWLWIAVTLVLGGWTAWMTGRAIALAWKPAWLAALAALPLALAVRFIHFALFEGSFLSPRYYLADLLVVLVIVLLAHRYARAAQMARQYRWMIERAGPFSWREKPQARGSANG